MIKDIAIYGAGGLGREIAVMIEQINQQKKQWNLIGYFDDGQSYSDKLRHKVLGGMAALNQFGSSLSVVLAIADPLVRKRVASGIINSRIDFPPLVHPKATCGESINMSKGVIITAGSVLTTDITLRDYVIVNLNCTIGHDVSVGAFSSIMPGVNISGAVTIGQGCLLGTGSQILQNLSIGDGVKIGAGAVVTRNIERGTAVGVPAKNISHDPRI